MPVCEKQLSSFSWVRFSVSSAGEPPHSHLLFLSDLREDLSDVQAHHGVFCGDLVPAGGVLPANEVVDPWVNALHPGKEGSPIDVTLEEVTPVFPLKGVNPLTHDKLRRCV